MFVSFSPVKKPFNNTIIENTDTGVCTGTLIFSDDNFSGSAVEVIAALKLKIRDQEKVMKKDKSKCLICMVK